MISRSFERRSDRTAIALSEKPGAFISAMAKFANLYLSLAYPPGLVEWYGYDHPPIGRRIKMAEDAMREYPVS